MKHIAQGIIGLVVAAAALQGCATMDDMTTFFNVYYNADRIMKEVEEPVDAQEAAQNTTLQQAKGLIPKGVKPPEYFDELIRNPNFDAARRVISGTVVQRANAASQTIKLDSVVNKCTKILKFHSNSSYVPPALYMLAKAFYYKGKQTDFLYSKQKTEEFIQTFSDHELYVDAHLLLAEDLIALKDNDEATRALSRCIDVALPRKRYDVVSKALRYTADLAMQRGDLEGAVRPYLHAMLLSHNAEANATWQLEIGTLNLITSHDADAAQAFRDVSKYDPDLYTEFAAQYGLGIALRQLHQFDTSKAQLEHVRDKSAYSQWKPWVEIELATLRWVRGEQPEAAEEYRRIDTAYATTEASSRATFEWGMRALLAGDYGTAKGRFEKVRATMVSYSKEAERLYNVLVVGDAASRDMVILESRMAGTDTGMTAQPSLTRRGNDTVSVAQSGTAPILNIEAMNPPQSSKIDSTTIDSTARVISPDSLAAAKRRQDSLAIVAVQLRRQLARDSVRNALALAYYDVARMYFMLGHEDSMVSYYQRIIALGGKSEIISTTLYSYALYLREKGIEPGKVDTLMQTIVDHFPKTRFSPMARMHLGLTDEENVDSAQTEYVSGERFMMIHDDTTAIRRFLHVAARFPTSNYAPQSLYAIGWIFETETSQYDSARYYYGLLVKLYPNSEFAKRVKPLLAVAAVDTTKKESLLNPGAAPGVPPGQSPNTFPIPGAHDGAPSVSLPPGVSQGNVIRNNPAVSSMGQKPVITPIPKPQPATDPDPKKNTKPQ